MRLNKPELKCRLQNQHRRRRRTAGNERRGGRVQQYQQWGKLCEQEFGEEEELDRVNTTACWHQSWRTIMTEARRQPLKEMLIRFIITLTTKQKGDDLYKTIK